MRAQNPARRGFTLVELLVVIAIIGILASLSLVAIARIRIRGQVADARRQMQSLANAIVEYRADNGTYPVSDAVKNAAIAGGGDFTYGGAALDAVFGGAGAWSTNNSEVIAILMDRQNYPATGVPTVDFDHVKNTRQKRYLVADMVEGSVNTPGLGQDLVYRDPWGNPYIISLDLSYDEKCRDALYQKSTVSRDSAATGFNGLFNSADATGASDQFEYHGGVMIWSLGPDKKADFNQANAAANRDNVVSWK